MKHLPKPKVLKQTNLSKKKKDALIELGKFCFDEVGYKLYLKEIRSLKNYDNHEEYGSTLSYLSTKLEEELLLQFFCLDWKAEISQLDSMIEQSLKQNFDLKIEMDISDEFTDESSISAEGCFKKFKNVLRAQKMDIKILDSGSDDYIFLLHRTKKETRVLELLNDIEFEQIKNEQ